MNNLFSKPFGLNIRQDGEWHIDAAPAYGQYDVVRYEGIMWAAALTPFLNEKPSAGPSWIKWGPELSDSLIGDRKAADGVAASEWALAQVQAAIAPATPDRRGTVAPGTSENAVLLAGDVASFEDAWYIWTNNGNGTGTLEIKQSHFARLIVQGGGGGGGGVASAGNLAASGGASGEAVIGTSFLQVGSAIPVMFGTAGVGISGANGTNGGASSFGSLFTALGGTAGRSSVGNSGGTNSIVNVAWSAPRSTWGGMSISNPGGTGVRYSQNASGGVAAMYSGYGGRALFGAGGSPLYVSSTSNPSGINGVSGSGYGGGGSGAVSYLTNNTSYKGGNGAPGCIYIERIG